MKSVLAIFCSLSLIGLFIYEVDGSRQTKIQTPSGNLVISKREKKQLEALFRDLIIYNSGGYTLLGSKPLTFDCVRYPFIKWDFDHLLNALFPSNLKKYKNWKTFKKFQKHLSGKNILLWEEPSPWNKNVQLIVLANKKELHRIVTENRTEMEKVEWESLGKQPLLKEMLQSHDGKIGTVLGYGKNNSWLFSQNRNQLPSEGIFSDEISRLFTNKKVCLNFMIGWPHVSMKEVLMYPTFIAKLDSEETKNLKEEYLTTRSRILNYYEGKDFLEATVQLLLQE